MRGRLAARWGGGYSGMMQERLATVREELAARGQAHVLRFWEELSAAEREVLLEQLEAIPWAVLDPVMETHVRGAPGAKSIEGLEPPRVYPAKPDAVLVGRYAEAQAEGERLLCAGRVAAFTVAGGQGTRLGVDGPKGAVRVTPIRGKSLFQVFAEAIVAVRARSGAAIPWYIMTSAANDAATRALFEEAGYFGLPRGDVTFFSQGMLPAFHTDGRLLLEAKGRLALSPNGHGGSLTSLVERGALRDMQARGITCISYFQVDNPLVQPLDPLFIGLHALTGAEMSTKVTAKADDLEKVGNVCVQGGRVRVIEYTNFPESLARARNPDGSRRFDAGNLAIHLLEVGFVERIVAQGCKLPLNRALKRVAYVDESGRVVEPAAPNAVKLEMFIFDALPLAGSALVLEVERAEEFSPVKNARGADSLETAQRDMVRRSARWLELAGVAVPRRADGEPDAVIEIAASFALCAEDVKRRSGEISAPARGGRLYLE